MNNPNYRTCPACKVSQPFSDFKRVQALLHTPTDGFIIQVYECPECKELFRRFVEDSSEF